MIRDAIGFMLREEDAFKYSMSPVASSLTRMFQNVDKHIRGNPKPEDTVRMAADVLGLSLGLPADAATIPIWNAIVAGRTGVPFGTKGVPVATDMVVRRRRPKGERQ
jgi:hypothetical protein